MRPNLLLYAGAALLLAGCRSTPDWNNGPYAKYGFTYDLTLSPIASLSVEDAQAVLATPSGYAPWTSSPAAAKPTTSKSTVTAAPAPLVSQAPPAESNQGPKVAEAAPAQPAPAPPAQ